LGMCGRGKAEFTLTRGRKTMDVILSEPVGKKFLTMLEKPKAEKEYKEARMLSL